MLVAPFPAASNPKTDRTENVRNRVRLASDKQKYAGEITGEWAKQVLAATRTAAEALTKKS